jgi:hypothetical protein
MTEICKEANKASKYTEMCWGNEERHEEATEDFTAVGSRRTPVHVLYR